MKEVDREYRTTLGFPVPTHAGSITRAIGLLCKDGKLGLSHSRGNVCGALPELSDREILDATIEDPFPGSDRIAPPTIRSEQPTEGRVPPQESPPISPQTGRQVSLRTPPQPGIGALRQAAAGLLQEYPSARVIRARFAIFLEQVTGDLSALPSAFRGSLSGAGTLSVEIAVTKEEDMAKADLEEVIERLPNIPRAEYSADLTLLLPPEAGSA